MSSSAVVLKFVDPEVDSTQEEVNRVNIRAPSRSKRLRKAVKNFFVNKFRAVHSAFAQCTQAVE